MRVPLLSQISFLRTLLISTLYLLCLLTTPPAYGAGSRTDSLLLDGGLGMPALSLTNPDGTRAGYSGLSLYGRLALPIFDSGSFVSFFNLGIRYHDLKNTASTLGTTETANHLAPGAGLSFALGRITLGYEYNFVLARHFYFGAGTNNQTEFEFSTNTYYLGYALPIGRLSFGAVYSMSTGSIPAGTIGMSKSSSYREDTIWINLTLNLGFSLRDLGKQVVSK